LSALVVSDAATLPAPLGEMPRTTRLFSALAPHDRRHLVAVHRACIANGLSLEMTMAGLLHDVGKASLSGRRVTVLDRSVRVVLARWRPELLVRLCRVPTPAWRLGLVLANEHATLGAGRLAALGWPDSIVTAVREHQSDSPKGGLATLRRIDDTTP